MDKQGFEIWSSAHRLKLYRKEYIRMIIAIISIFLIVMLVVYLEFTEVI